MEIGRVEDEGRFWWRTKMTVIWIWVRKEVRIGARLLTGAGSGEA